VLRIPATYITAATQLLAAPPHVHAPVQVVAAALTGGYSSSIACSSIPSSLRAACRAWLVAMPVAAAQLVLVTAAESGALVGQEGWADVLPLAASGPGEPLGTAAGLLGVMSMWRAFYAVYIYSWSQGEFVVRRGCSCTVGWRALHAADLCAA
jgi:hypothetical protein